MPKRTTPLVTGEFYHIFNRGIAGLPTFTVARDYRRFLDAFHYYLNENVTSSFSKFTLLSIEERSHVWQKLATKRNFYVDPVSYCLMPNHFHFVVKQLRENGISLFIGNVTNSYTHYYNTKHWRVRGPLFQGRFEAVRLETEEQLVHVVRYVHLNPHTGYIVKTTVELERYPHSSFPVYLGLQTDPFINQNYLKQYFHSPKALKQFTFDQSEYQRQLRYIKHLLLEEV